MDELAINKCLDDYQIIDKDKRKFVCQNIKTKQKYQLLLESCDIKNPSLDNLKLIKFIKSMKNTNLLTVNIIDYCLIDNEILKSKMNSELLKIYKNEYRFYNFNQMFFIVIYLYKEIDIIDKELDSFDLFDLYYNLLTLKFNFNMNMKPYITFIKYDQPVLYLICNKLFEIENVKYKILFNFDNIVENINSISFDTQFYETIYDIKDIIFNVDYKNHEIKDIISKHKRSIDMLSDLAIYVFNNKFKKINDKERKEIK
jgi:hypothetical protein